MDSEVKQKGKKRVAGRPSGGRGLMRVPGKTRLSAKNQITLPVGVVRSLGLQPGDEFAVDADGEGRVVVTRIDSSDPVLALAGSLTGMFPPNALEILRAGDRAREIELGMPVEDNE